jgi:hypothetical protein
LESGLNLEEIEQMGVRQKIAWLELYREKKRKNRVIDKLEINEAVNYAIVGSRPKEKGQRSPVNMLNRWRKRLIRSITPKKQREPTLWDKIAIHRKSRKAK